jgi:hypothetical protein
MIRFYKLGQALIFENSNGAQFPGTIQVYRDNPGDTKLNVLDTARNILLESQVEWDEFFKQDGATNWGTDAATTEANLNTEAQGSGSLTEVPTITSATTIELTEGQSLNYELTADYGAGFEWGTLPAGVVTTEGNVRKLVGGQGLTAAGSPYTFTARAVNYNGFDEETITLNVSAPAFNNTYSTSFNTGQYISMPPTSALNFYRSGGSTGQAWTVSFWVKPNNASNNGQVISYFGGDDPVNEGGARIQLMGTDRRIRIRYGSNNNNLQIQSGNNVLTYGVWHHVLCTYDGGTTENGSGGVNTSYSRFKIFIDGAEVSYSNSNSNYGYSGSVLAEVYNIGRQTSGNYLLGSLVDEYALWNSDQSGSVADIYNSGTIHDLNALTTAPDLWLRLGDGDTLPTFSDSAGTYDGVAQGMTAANIVTDVKS